MDQSHPLNLNLQKVTRCLGGVLLPEELAKITNELYRNVRQALRLSEVHLRFARSVRRQGTGAWRQAVSRGYYSCYCASRAVRLATTGVFSTETDDHKKIGDLPDKFPSRALWADVLTKYRADRNLADYDHSVARGSLEYSADQYLAHATNFLRDVKRYLQSEGIL